MDFYDALTAEKISLPPVFPLLAKVVLCVIRTRYAVLACQLWRAKKKLA
jgi:hypothetical protein